MTTALSSLYPNIALEPYTYVSLPPVHDLEGWKQSLSKKARQNLRTAYNRCNRDGLAVELLVSYPCRKGKDWSDAVGLYIRRQVDQYEGRIMGSRLLTYLYFHHLKHDMQSMVAQDNSFLSLLRLNGQAAGVIMGFSKGERLVVPRLAIAGSLSFYSPGMILVEETLKYILEHTELRVLDLGRGDERYKFSLGGEEYYRYCFSMDL